jgi:hypothetical protein
LARGDASRDDLARGYARARDRDDAIRAGLVPLAPDERPLPLRLSAALAALLCLGNLALVVSGAHVDGKRPVLAALVFAALMAAAAVGIWKGRYGAVLGFEALLACLLLWAALSLLVASNLAAALLCLAVFAVAGPLFWLEIRVMARMQATRRAAEDERVY